MCLVSTPDRSRPVQCEDPSRSLPRPAYRHRGGSRSNPKERPPSGFAVFAGRCRKAKCLRLVCILLGQIAARRCYAVPNCVIVLASSGQFRVHQAGCLRRDSGWWCRAEHGQSIRQFSVRSPVCLKRRSERTQAGDRVVLARLQIRLFPLLGHGGNIQQDQAGRQQLPGASFAYQAECGPTARVRPAEVFPSRRTRDRLAASAPRQGASR